ncbi:MAG: hypothetical protein D6785_10265 [Planctomycetota bacterium]|nr:MAG: hypothetical protein D6785_10265 [Planctomycetota bacterium]
MCIQTIANSVSESKMSTSKKWFYLSLFSLVLAGILALILVIGRAPYVNQLIYSPSWAKKCLVIHVNLALGVWFFAFFMSIWSLVYEVPRWPFYLAFLGTGLFAVAAFFLPGNPVLSNYIPALDQPVFQIGIFLFYLAVAFAIIFSFFSGKKELALRSLPYGTILGLQVAAFGYLLAFGLFILTFFLVPTSWKARPYYEMLFWGPGHLLQLVHMASMTSLWIFFISRLLQKDLLPRWGFQTLYSLLLIPMLITPFLYIHGINDALYYRGFTKIMRWGTWPMATLLSCILFWHLTNAGFRRFKSSPIFWGFSASFLLMALGFFLGAMISRSTTLIPAHYHAAIGAVTLAYMTMTYPLLRSFGLGQKILGPKITSLQPVFFGLGQAIFALGFAYGGIHGLARKVYGHEQQIRTTEEYIGLAIMGVGGCLAIIGGILFLYLAGKSIFDGPLEEKEKKDHLTPENNEKVIVEFQVY